MESCNFVLFNFVLNKYLAFNLYKEKERVKQSKRNLDFSKGFNILLTGYFYKKIKTTVKESLFNY